MTKVNVVQDSNDIIVNIHINDHAGFAEYGNDIVCAAISSIIFGTLNALVHYGCNQKQIIVDDSKASIHISLNDENDLQVVAQTMLIQLQTIQESYPDYIKIKTN